MIFANEVLHDLRIGTVGDNLNAIARGKDHRLRGARSLEKCGESGSDLVRRKSETFADFHGCCLMANADQCELHGIQG
jgi:hypothetical protein